MEINLLLLAAICFMLVLVFKDEAAKIVSFRKMQGWALTRCLLAMIMCEIAGVGFFLFMLLFVFAKGWWPI